MKGHVPSLRLSARPWRSRRWLVLAPHPDDETLGAGALIAQVAASGHLAGVVYLTDGSSSHPRDHGEGSNMIGVRKREAALALRRLAGHSAKPPLFLGWQDAHPFAPEHTRFVRSYRALAALCIRLQVDVLAATAPNEPHCDHAAAAQLALAVKKVSKRPLILADYVVWGDKPSCRTHRAVATDRMSIGLRRKALSAHRSQLTAAHGPGFRLPEDQRAMRPFDLLFIRR